MVAGPWGGAGEPRDRTLTTKVNSSLGDIELAQLAWDDWMLLGYLVGTMRFDLAVWLICQFEPSYPWQNGDC